MTKKLVIRNNLGEVTRIMIEPFGNYVDFSDGEVVEVEMAGGFGDQIDISIGRGVSSVEAGGRGRSMDDYSLRVTRKVTGPARR